MTRNEHKRNRSKIALIVAVILWAILLVVLLATSGKPTEQSAESDTEPLTEIQDGRVPGDDIPALTRCYLTDEEIEAEENEMIESALLAKAHVIKDCTITYYDVCVKCCGKTDGITASGVKAVPGVTVAVDPSVIPFGSDVLIDFGDGDIQYYKADDSGYGVDGNHVDICVKDHATAIQGSITTATVYWIGADEE
jgi:3D (Asp-Asp-Asp) domain-containing protein